MCSGSALYARDGTTFAQLEFVWPVTAALMAAAAYHDGELNILDFGGTFGAVYYQNKAFLQCLRRVRWNIVELPAIVERGQRDFEISDLHFYFSNRRLLKREST